MKSMSRYIVAQKVMNGELDDSVITDEKSFKALEKEREDLRLQLDDARDCEGFLRVALADANKELAELKAKLDAALSCPFHADGKHYCAPCAESVSL